MNCRHAAALALVGWYLMVPPTKQMVDSACNGTGFGGIKAFLRGGSDWNRVMCDREALQLNLSAPLSQWDSVNRGAFETLAECEAERARPVTENEKRGWELPYRDAFDEDKKNRPEQTEAVLPKDFVALTAQTHEYAIQLSRCVASDDPRLAK